MATPDPRTISLFLAALELADPTDRAAYLERECGDHTELRDRVQALLTAYDGSEHAPPGDATRTSEPSSTKTPESKHGSHAETRVSLEQVTSAERTADATAVLRCASGTDRSGASAVGQVIAGRYTLLEVLGQGGMGTVYLAKQTTPVNRMVALKLINVGMDSRAVIARFDAERQALALMDHPNIARVYDGGSTTAGQPFFVMELVDGEPITTYCDRYRLPVRARLELFVSVCQAVQHAHQKGIIHRDLKPSNVMVSEVDGRPTPKIIDFGVAKATEFKLTDQSLGDTGAIVGTPAYMSPEQADPSSMDIDTRTDVYALGVILYELLAGSPPIEMKQLKRGAILEMLRMVREVDPPRPSTKVSTADALPSIAACRDVEPAHLKRVLQGDLDWIVMKALEKDRNRRYETANGFAADILRHLAHEPVVAAPPSRAYRLRKFVRKHRGPVIAASLVLLALVIGMAGTTWGLIEARRQREEARKQELRAVAAQQAEAKRAEGERLAKTLAQAKEAEAERAQLRAEQEKTIAQSVRDFLQNKLLAQTDPRTQANALVRAGASATQAKPNPTIRELLDRAAQELAPEKIESRFPKQPLIQAEILQTIGDTYRRIGEYESAIELLKRSEALRRQALGPEHSQVLESMHDLAMAYRDAKKFDLSLPLFEETLKVAKAKLGPDHPLTLKFMAHLGWAYHQSRKLHLALPLQEEAVRLMKAKLGPDDPETRAAMSDLASSYYNAGKFDLALPLQEEMLRFDKEKLGLDHPDTLVDMNSLAGFYAKAGELDRALSVLEDVVEVMKAKLGPDHPDTLVVIKNTGYIRNLTSAPERYQAALAQKGADDINTLLARRDMAQLFITTHRLDDAESILVELTERMKNRALDDAVRGYTTGLLNVCRGIREASEPDSWKTFNSRSKLGGALLHLKKYGEAERHLITGYEGLKAREKQIPPASRGCLVEAIDRLIKLFTLTNKPADVQKWQAKRAKYHQNR